MREAKDERQFIFTTHNSSVAVASHTDKFTIMQGEANKGRVVFSGSLNGAQIKQEVIDIWSVVIRHMTASGKNTIFRELGPSPSGFYSDYDCKS